MVLTHARALLTSGPEGATSYVDADLRDVETILASSAEVLDLPRPVAVMLIAVLHLVGDEDDPQDIQTPTPRRGAPRRCGAAWRGSRDSSLIR